MFLFGKPNLRKMAQAHDVDGLVALLTQRRPQIRLEAAEALAGLNEGRGWRYLLDAVRDPSDALLQAAAAEILGELGHPRAVPALQEALPAASGEARAAIAEALAALGAADASEPESAASADAAPAPPLARSLMGNLFGSIAAGEGALEEDLTAPAAPLAFSSGQIAIASPETYFQAALDLREDELQERGLVMNRLATWLQPDWAEVWYLRGVLFEDLDRPREAVLAYRQALALDPRLSEARHAADELSVQLDDDPAELPTSPTDLLRGLSSASWQQRRDTLAVLTDSSAIDEQAVLTCLQDEEREVRHAALEAIARLRLPAAHDALLAQRETSWLLRFAVLEALSALGQADAVAQRLRREMADLQARNPVFLAAKDPLVEVETDLMLQIGVLALERTGDLGGLLDQAEGNTWEDLSVEDEEEAYSEGEGRYEEAAYHEGDAAFAGEAEDDLLSYVDETGLMVAQALERLAAHLLPGLAPRLVQRLAETPDLTLLDLSDESSQPAVAHSFATLRAAAAAELTRRTR